MRWGWSAGPSGWRLVASPTSAALQNKRASVHTDVRLLWRFCLLVLERFLPPGLNKAEQQRQHQKDDQRHFNRTKPDTILIH